jgi:xanthine dehydrogenase accessory factor
LICGGQLEVFIEPVMPVPSAYIFGAGHVSQSLAKIAALAGFRTVVIDNREAFANRERFPEADEIHAAEYEELFPRLEINESSYLAIVTRGHKDDMRVLRWAVSTPARYIGMIGSRRKAIEVFRTLEEEGLSREQLERVHTPIGLEIGAESPEEIGVAVVAEMIAVRRGAPLEQRQAFTKSVYAR